MMMVVVVAMMNNGLDGTLMTTIVAIVIIVILCVLAIANVIAVFGIIKMTIIIVVIITMSHLSHNPGDMPSLEAVSWFPSREGFHEALASCAHRSVFWREIIKFVCPGRPGMSVLV